MRENVPPLWYVSLSTKLPRFLSLLGFDIFWIFRTSFFSPFKWPYCWHFCLSAVRRTLVVSMKFQEHRRSPLARAATLKGSSRTRSCTPSGSGTSNPALIGTTIYPCYGRTSNQVEEGLFVKNKVIITRFGGNSPPTPPLTQHFVL